jgi:hypothetical protein
MKRQDLSAARSDVVRRAFALLGAFLTVAPAFAAEPATQFPRYGYCYATTADQKKMYFSAAFEMPLPDIQEHLQVMSAEFLKVLVQKYGAQASGGCTAPEYTSKAATEEKLQTIFATARQSNMQIIDTGWTFVRTPQTPPPGRPVSGH